ncbi:type I restriction enzyme HsdR N-terminal domain-containing protein [Viscerimonas tarda]
MVELNLPPYNAKIKKGEKAVLIWDCLRSKYLVLTPEEWVRQHFVNYLITEKAYPQSLIANEKQILLNNRRKRCDTIVYSRTLSPLVIVEYKSPEVPINQYVFDQIVRYNMVLKVNYLIVSNGLQHYCCAMDYGKQTFRYLEEIPRYEEL